MEYLPLVFIAAFILFMGWLALRACDDIDYCIKETYKQKRIRDERQARIEERLEQLLKRNHDE